MGISESETELGQKEKAESKRVLVVSILMVLIAFFAPFATSGYDYGSSFYLNIAAILWSLSYDGYYFGFHFVGIPYSINMIPYLMFRVAFVYQIARYYQGLTTRSRTAIVAVLSEAPILFMYTVWVFGTALYGGGAWGLNFPLPIMTTVGLLILWRFPVPEMKDPWSDADKSVSWWEKQTSDKNEFPSDNQP